MDNARLGLLLAEAGPLDDGILEVVDIAGSSRQWAVRFRDIDLLATNLPDAGLVSLSTVIPGPPAAAAEQAYRALLAANALGPRNGGLRYALASDQNHVEVSLLLAAASLVPADLARHCRTVAETAAAWSLLFSGAVPDLPTQADAAIPDPFNPDIIRL